GVAVVGQSDLRAEGQSYEFHEGSEEVSTIRGKHTFDGKAKLSAYHGELQFAAFSAGRAIVPSLTALAAGSADLFEIGQGGSHVSYDLSALNFTLDDTYRARPKVTLNGGIGYKAEFPPSFQESDHG